MKQSETNQIFIDIPAEKVSTIDNSVLELKFTHQQLHDALMYAQDVLERSMITFVLLGNTARQVMSHELPSFSEEFVHIGVQERYLTKACLSIFKSLVYNPTVSQDTIHFLSNGVPVKIDIIHGKYEFFDHPDVRFYAITEFMLPNPFDRYWEVKDEIV